MFPQALPRVANYFWPWEEDNLRGTQLRTYQKYPRLDPRPDLTPAGVLPCGLWLRTSTSSKPRSLGATYICQVTFCLPDHQKKKSLLGFYHYETLATASVLTQWGGWDTCRAVPKLGKQPRTNFHHALVHSFCYAFALPARYYLYTACSSVVSPSAEADLRQQHSKGMASLAFLHHLDSCDFYVHLILQLSHQLYLKAGLAENQKKNP